MMELQFKSELSALGKLILDRKKNVVAEVSMELEPERICAYTHLFSAGPELLHFLENEVRSALEENDKMKPKPTLTGFRGYSGSSTYPSLPLWVDKAVQAMAVAYDEAVPMTAWDLCISADDPNALEDDEGHVVVRVSKELSEDTARNMYASS